MAKCVMFFLHGLPTFWRIPVPHEKSYMLVVGGAFDLQVYQQGPIEKLFFE